MGGLAPDENDLLEEKGWSRRIRCQEVLNNNLRFITTSQNSKKYFSFI
jgi:hypothetical protein